MNTNKNNPLIVRLLDVQKPGTLDERKIVRRDSQEAKQKSLAEEKILMEGERKAEEILTIGNALLEETEIKGLKAEKQKLQKERNEAFQLANLTDVASLKKRFLAQMTSAEGQLFLIAEKIKELEKPTVEAEAEAARIRAEAKQDAMNALLVAEEDPAVKLEKEVVDGLRKYFMRMVESGKTSEAVDLAAKDENMALYQEIKAAAKIKEERMKAARKVFSEGLTNQVGSTQNAAAWILVKDLIIGTSGKGQEVAQFAVDEKGGVIRREPRRHAVWKLEGNNVIRVQSCGEPANA